MSQATLWFAHGWAYDASFWEPLRAACPTGPRWPTTPAISAPRLPEVCGPVIAIGHSLGALRLLRQPPPGCAGLVCINGFARFGAGPDFPEGVAPRLLDRMLRQLAAQPQAVLRDFRARCGDDTPSGAPDMAALERGLLALRDEDRRAGLAALPMPALGAGRRRGSGRAAGHDRRGAARRRAALACARRPSAAAIGPAVVRRAHPRLRVRPGRHRSLT